jgi:glycerol-3-phosphate dehydrogenase (NAD(P)+)
MKVTVLGAGSWGTTVASLAAGRNDTLLWARDAAVAETVRSSHENDRYQAGDPLPEQLDATDDLERAARHSQVLVVGVPSHAFRPTLEAVREYLHPWVPVVSLTKGLEQGSMRHHQTNADCSAVSQKATVLGCQREYMRRLTLSSTCATL